MKTSWRLLGICLVALTPMAFGAGAPATRPVAGWPQWQGPNRDNISPDTGLLKTWPAGGPKLLWTYDKAGMGYSSPAVVGDRFYSQGAWDGQEYVFALDAKTGTKLWECAIGPMLRQNRGDGPRGTPTVDGEFVYSIGGQGDVACVKASNGDKVWVKNMRRELGGTMQSGWGYSESPLVDGDRVVCTPGGKDGTIAALNKKTGEVIWRSTDLTDKAAYSSIVATTIGGVRQYVQMTGDSVSAVAPKDGRLLWRFPRVSRVAAIPTPVCSKDYVYVTSGYGTGCTLLKIKKEGGKFEPEEVYANKNMSNKHDGVVLLDGYVYGYSEGKGWECQDFLSGKIKWLARGKFDKGSVVYAEGHVYCYSQRDGTLVRIKASPAGWQEDGRMKLPRMSDMPRPPSQRRDNVWTHPVIANGRLYLRDQDLFFCFDLKAK